MNIEDNNPEDGDNFLNEVIAVIDECFKPVDDLKGLNEYLTTEDVFDAVQALYPGDHYDASTIARMMMEAGFKFTAHPSSTIQFVWLLKRC